MKKLLLPSLVAAALASCVVGANPEPPPHLSLSSRDASSAERHFPPAPPSPWPPGAPPVPEGVPWHHDQLEHRYNTGPGACFEASKKAFAALKFTLTTEDMTAGVATAQMGPIWGRCSMRRKNDLTYLTFYIRVQGQGAEERMPADFAERCHVIVAELVKEEGRPTDK